MKGYFRRRGNAWSYTVDIGIDPATEVESKRQKEDLGQKKKRSSR